MWGFCSDLATCGSITAARSNRLTRRRDLSLSLLNHFPTLPACLSRPSLCNQHQHLSTTGWQFDISEQSWVPVGRLVGGKQQQNSRASDQKRSKKVLMSMLEARRWFLVMTKWLSPACSAAISRSIVHHGRAPLDNSTVKEGK